jgi:alginate O-acetyltransferase complex protein AlgI
MLFGTLEIWLILPLAILMYYFLPHKYRWSILLIGSMLYLGYYSIPFLIYATVYALANYFFGRILFDQSDEKKRKRLYLIFIIINVGQLLVFKYLDFITQNLNIVAGSITDNKIPYLNLLVPIGISYYTFQCIGYIVNVYRKVEKPEKHIGYFIIYNLFFPKILSGPIERSEKFLPQLRNPKPFSPEVFKYGLKLILYGVAKKLIIAERLAVIVNNVYGNIDHYTGISLVIVMFIQAIYIYTDFSGYTDIALGIANLFGISLTDNFNRPFFSTNVTNFWRRWHISLSTWCNDYIFKTIIFKRRKWGIKAAVYGVFVTFFIIGLWHGPMWTYVILGILQGIAINYEYFFKRKRLEIGSKIGKFWNDTLSRIITYMFFCFSLIFFFSHSLADSLYFVGHLFDFNNFVFVGNNLGLEIENVIIVSVAIVIVFAVEVLEERGIRIMEVIYKRPLWIRWSLYYIFILIIILYGQFATTNFIYFKF